LEGGFDVKSSDGCHNYYCDMESEYPSCSCPDFDKYNWPCKHMVAIMMIYPGFGWDFLPDNYRNLPCFVIDEDAIEGKLDLGNGKETEMEESKTSRKDMSEANVLSECRNVHKNIENILFIVPEHAILSTLKMLRNVDKEIVTFIPNVHGAKKGKKGPFKPKHNPVIPDKKNERKLYTCTSK
jgi:hypothetical protein